MPEFTPYQTSDGAWVIDTAYEGMSQEEAEKYSDLLNSIVAILEP